MEIYLGVGLLAAAMILFLVACSVPEESSRLTLFLLKSEFMALIITILAAFGIAEIAAASTEDGSVIEALLAVAALAVILAIARRVIKPRHRHAHA